MNQFDILIIDHFRAFDTYWKIPAHAQTAKDGEWVEGFGLDFFNKLSKQQPNLKLVAEDLGEIRDEVIDLRNQFKLPGMQ